METTERVRLLIVPIVEDSGAELYDLTFNGGVLRISLDKAGGVDIGVIGSVTRAISRMLDETDPIAGAFTLEVSSPGLERPLRTPEHFQRAIGELISVKTNAGVGGDRRCKGTLTEADDESITITPAGGGDPRQVAQHDIERATTVFEWGPTPKPGGPKSTSSKQKAAKS